MPEARDRRPDGRDGWPLCFGLREPLRQRLGVLGGSPVPWASKAPVSTWVRCRSLFISRYKGGEAHGHDSISRVAVGALLCWAWSTSSILALHGPTPPWIELAVLTWPCMAVSAT